MRRKLFLIILAIFILLSSGCAAPKKFQRIGEPSDFLSADKTVSALYGNPAVFVDINVGGRNVGSWFGIIGNAVGTSSDRNQNQIALNNLLESGIQPYAQDEIALMISNVLREFEELSTGDSIKLSLDSDKAKVQKENIPESTEIFAVDSHLSFYAAAPNNLLAASFGAVEGIATKLEIHITYLSPAPERKTIWKDVFICELEPIQECLVDNNCLKAKELIKIALDKLMPWIANELRGGANENFQRINIQYQSNLWDEGYLLSETDDFIAIRLIDGMTRILPKYYIKNMEIVKK